MARAVGIPIPDLLNRPEGASTPHRGMSVHSLLNPSQNPSELEDRRSTQRSLGSKAAEKAMARSSSGNIGCVGPETSESSRSFASDSLPSAQPCRPTNKTSPSQAEPGTLPNTKSMPSPTEKNDMKRDAGHQTPFRPTKPSARASRTEGPSGLDDTPYQLIIPTDSGPLVVPVEMQHSAKSPYAIRRRNALASARYRARKRMKATEDAQVTTASGDDNNLSEDD